MWGFQSDNEKKMIIIKLAINRMLIHSVINELNLSNINMKHRIAIAKAVPKHIIAIAKTETKHKNKRFF